MLAGVVLFALIPISTTLQCYSCSSCNDPFNTDSAPTMQFPGSEGYSCTKSHTMNGIMRGVAKACNMSDTELWCCQKDLCNGDHRHALTKFMYFAIATVMVINYFRE